jgi:hypothetical protein
VQPSQSHDSNSPNIHCRTYVLWKVGVNCLEDAGEVSRL